MIPADVADLVVAGIGLFAWWLVMYAPIPGAGDDE